MSRRSPRPNRPGQQVEDRGAPLRTKPTTGNLGPRDPGPHGKTLTSVPAPVRARRRALRLLPRLFSPPPS